MRLNLRNVRPLIALGICACAAATASSADEEITNYRSGISLNWLGEKGVDYQEEYLYFDKVISDVKIVYIKSATKIDMSHNELNKAGVPSANDSYESVGLDVGKIRYKVDGDQRWEMSIYSYTEYSAPVAFDDLTYAMFGEADVKTVGSTGDNGYPLTLENKTKRYHRGMRDEFGDEWHTITVADDDSGYAGSTEFKASDGKIFYFIVNPKTPALTVRANGTGQFYTTPPKKYFIPKIYDLTTYIDTGASGNVSFEINDINGNNVFYRVNGGTFVNAGSKSVTIDASKFTAGENTLEYYYAGNEQYIRTRKVVKSPDYPSKGEEHGDRLWVNANYWEKDVKPRLRNDNVWWLDQWRTGDTWNGRKSLEYHARKGKRLSLVNAGLPNALVARVYGFKYKNSKYPYTFADYAKLALFETPTTIDPVGAELNTSNTAIPCREIIYRGYYDMNSIVETAAVYDILIGHYRRDQGHAKGISPIEDLFIRDSLASWVHLSTMIDIAGYSDPMWDDFNSGGMWDTARKIGAAMIVAMMPNYSTPVYGTSGMNGQPAEHKWTPFRDVAHTWKEIFFDNDVKMDGFPNVHKRFGIEEYLVNSDGNYLDRRGYLGTVQMGHAFGIYYNLVKLFAPEKTLPNLEALKLRAAVGDLFGLKINSSSDEGPTQQVFACWQNRWHAPFKKLAQPIMLAITNDSSDNHRGKQFARGGPLYVVWYNHNIPLQSAPDGDPSNLLMVNATSSP